MTTLVRLGLFFLAAVAVFAASFAAGNAADPVGLSTEAPPAVETGPTGHGHGSGASP